ncbi:hypothetical protein S245_003549, partial [Arachis hypogaea]
LPEGGLPPNLKSLELQIGEEQMRDLSWMANLHALTHLRFYDIGVQRASPPHLPSTTTYFILQQAEAYGRRKAASLSLATQNSILSFAGKTLQEQ